MMKSSQMKSSQMKSSKMKSSKTLKLNRWRAGRPRSDHGFTLIELLVATTVTLLMIAAMSQAFAVVSQTISVNRATLEMSGQLRGVAVRLQADLDQETAPLQPWLDSNAGLGYFEYIEGPGNDWDSNNDNAHQDITRTDDNRFNRFLTYEQFSGQSQFNEVRSIDAKETRLANSARGDFDDVLMFTARSSAEPFVGQVLGTLRAPDQYGRRVLFYDRSDPTFTTIQSDTAEIIWWTWNGILYRRVLLVRPDILLEDPFRGQGDPLDLSERGGVVPDANPDMPDVFFFSANDLSVRLEPRFGPNRFIRVTNSLADLTLRQNRYAHVRTDPTNQLTDFPFPVWAPGLNPDPQNLAPEHMWLHAKQNVYQRGPDGQWGTTGEDDNDNLTNEWDEAGAVGSDDVLIRYARGEDVILANVLGFDVRAYDPQAQVRLYSTVVATQRVVPGDPGFFSPNQPNATVPASRGAYVDLGYRIHDDFVNVSDRANAGLDPLSHFSGIPQFGSNLPRIRRLRFATFDTWPLDYERDGLDQDNWGGPDQGTDGLDSSISINGVVVRRDGVDDVRERETSPPYVFPLRGLQVRIRVLDPDSRQVRQMTVAADFTGG